jgi:hypothetical protein
VEQQRTTSVLSRPERTTLSQQRETLLKVTLTVQERLFKKVWYILLQFSKRNANKQTNKQTPYLKEFRYVVLQVFEYSRQPDGGGPHHDVPKCQERAADYCDIPIFQYIPNKMQRYTVYFIRKLLYKFRVVLLPIIRSAYNCIYSICYLSDRYCYLPL